METTWAIVELMGHVRHAGRLSEEERFGVKMGRLDCPLAGDRFVTVLFGGQSVYRITIVDEAVARAAAEGARPEPVSAYEMRDLPAIQHHDPNRDGYDEDDEAPY